jgi:hypothetical protein
MRRAQRSTHAATESTAQRSTHHGGAAPERCFVHGCVALLLRITKAEPCHTLSTAQHTAHTVLLVQQPAYVRCCGQRGHGCPVTAVTPPVVACRSTLSTQHTAHSTQSTPLEGSAPCAISTRQHSSDPPKQHSISGVLPATTQRSTARSAAPSAVSPSTASRVSPACAESNHCTHCVRLLRAAQHTTEHTQHTAHSTQHLPSAVGCVRRRGTGERTAALCCAVLWAAQRAAAAIGALHSTLSTRSTARSTARILDTARM